MIQEILEKIRRRDNVRVRRSVFAHGKMRYHASPALYCFSEKGVTCVSCGITADAVVFNEVDSNAVTHSINFYAGDELMTCDHIIPTSKQGSTRLENLQPMCKTCNEEKSDTLEIEPFIYYDLVQTKKSILSRIAEDMHEPYMEWHRDLMKQIYVDQKSGIADAEFYAHYIRHAAVHFGASPRKTYTWASVDEKKTADFNLTTYGV